MMKVLMVLGWLHVMFSLTASRSWMNPTKSADDDEGSSALTLLAALCSFQGKISERCLEDVRIPTQLHDVIQDAVRKQKFSTRGVFGGEPFPSKREDSNFFSDW